MSIIEILNDVIAELTKAKTKKLNKLMHLHRSKDKRLRRA